MFTVWCDVDHGVDGKAAKCPIGCLLKEGTSVCDVDVKRPTPDGQLNAFCGADAVAGRAAETIQRHEISLLGVEYDCPCCVNNVM